MNSGFGFVSCKRHQIATNHFGKTDNVALFGRMRNYSKLAIIIVRFLTQGISAFIGGYRSAWNFFNFPGDHAIYLHHATR